MLRITYFGNHVLRHKSKELSVAEITSAKTQDLIDQMKELVKSKKFGIGLAAPQIGESFAVCVIAIKSTPTRPNLEPYEKIIINPSFEGIGRHSQLWEGCISSGVGNNSLYAKVPRYRKIKATYYDQKGKFVTEILDGIKAHVFQHETDHVNGILFVDRVKDTKSYMLASEYRKLIKAEKLKNERRFKK